MSTLLRFDGDNTGRGVSGGLWTPVADWPAGATPGMYHGTLNVEDFVPYRGSDVGITLAGSDTPTLTELAERHGVVRMAGAAAADSEVGVVVNQYVDLSENRPAVVEARVEQNADANSPQMVVGFSDRTGDTVFASGAVASGTGVDTLALRWNADETIDLVSVVDGGDLNVLRTGIATVERTSGFVKLGLRVVKETSSQYSVYCSVNGAVTKVHGLTTSQIPQNPMKPIVATTVDTTTAPSVDCDWIATFDKV